MNGTVIPNARTMPNDDLSDYLAFLLASANRQMRLGIAQSIALEDVTEEHWRILRVLSDEAGRSMGELAQAVLLNHPALTKNIDRLAARGLVMRVPDKVDTRKVLVLITDLGLDMVSRLNTRVDAHHGAIEQALGPRKTLQLKRLLERFIADTSG